MFNDQETFETALIEWSKKYPEYDFESLGVSVSATDREGGFELKFPDFGLNYSFPVSYDELVDTYEFDSEEDLSLLDVDELSSLIRRTGYWNNKQCERLCELADMVQEWADADGENFEAVLDKAAKKLQVEIYR